MNIVSINKVEDVIMLVKYLLFNDFWFGFELICEVSLVIKDF